MPLTYLSLLSRLPQKHEDGRRSQAGGPVTYSASTVPVLSRDSGN